MSTDNIESRVLSEIERHLGLDRLPTLTSTFKENLGCDSLDSVELVMALEDEFCISIDDDDAEKCVTVADAVALVKSLSPS